MQQQIPAEVLVIGGWRLKPGIKKAVSLHTLSRNRLDDELMAFAVVHLAEGEELAQFETTAFASTELCSLDPNRCGGKINEVFERVAAENPPRLLCLFSNGCAGGGHFYLKIGTIVVEGKITREDATCFFVPRYQELEERTAA